MTALRVTIEYDDGSKEEFTTPQSPVEIVHYSELSITKDWSRLTLERES